MNPIPHGQAFPQQQQYPPMRDGDEKLYVQFYMGSLYSAEKSTAAGHPVFDSVPFVKIKVPGDKNTLIDTVVNNQHKLRFARMWAQFEQTQTTTLSGMPLRDWPGITRAQAEELYHLNIATVEQLASVADVYGQRIMGFHDLKRKAQTYLQSAKDTALANKLADENAALRSNVSRLEGEVKRLSDMFEKMQAKKEK